MKLTELGARFVQYVPRGMRRADSLRDAQGVCFSCPLCRAHSIVVWFAGRGVPDDATPLPRWSAAGSGLADLTLSPSINLDVPREDGCPPGCRWHGFVKDGCAS